MRSARKVLLTAAATLAFAAPSASATVIASMVLPEDGSTFYTGASSPDAAHTADFTASAKLSNDGCTSGIWNIERADAGQNNWASVTGSTVQESSELQTLQKITFAGDYEYRATVDCVSPDDDAYISPTVLVHVVYGTAPAQGPSCADAEQALAKARAKLRKLRKRHASKAKIKKAKKQVAARKKTADTACIA